MKFFTRTITLIQALIRTKIFHQKETHLTQSPFKGKSILLIEDDLETQRATKKILERRGFKTLLSSTGEEGLDTVKQHKPDIIILDSKLPGIQGPEVCKRIKSNPDTQKIPVIFLTVVDTSEAIISSFDYGADNYLTKPIKPTQLIAHIEKTFKSVQ